MRLTSRLWAGQAATETLYAKAAKRDTKRRDIVDSGLCKSVLGFLAPSLPKPNSCDVIDINPGICTWSLALNGFLTPRKHVFVEPNSKKYEASIGPLLSQHKSPYSLAETPEAALEDYTLGYFGKQDDRVTGSIQHRDWNGKPKAFSNDSLIISANLAGHVGRRGAYSGNFAKIFLHEYYRSVVAGAVPTNIHRDGLVRLLAWIPEDEKYAINPRSIIGRTKLSARLEASCTIREIASSFWYDGMTTPFRRWHPIDVESEEVVAKRQASTVLSVDSDRTQPSPEPPSNSYPPIPSYFKDMKKSSTRAMFINDLIKLDQEIKREDPEWYERYHNMADAERRKTQSEPNSNKKRFQLLMNRLRTTSNHYHKVKTMASERRALAREVIQAAEVDFGSASYLEKVTKVERQLEQLRNHTNTMFKDNRHAVEKAIDDYRLMDLPTPGLPWNARQFEPVFAKKSDFKPGIPMTLLEFTPKPEFVKALDTADKLICFEYVIFCFDADKGKSVAAAIRSLVGGGHAELMASIPDLWNPAKGGWYDLEQIRVRTLPVELLVDIAIALHDWPFRPPVGRMIEIYSSRRG